MDTVTPKNFDNCLDTFLFIETLKQKLLSEYFVFWGFTQRKKKTEKKVEEEEDHSNGILN